MKDWRDKLRELGFGNQAVIVGTKRRELFDEIEKMFVERENLKKVLQKGFTPDIEEQIFNDLAELRQQIKEIK
jgi:hypothetical protein